MHFEPYRMEQRISSEAFFCERVNTASSDLSGRVLERSVVGLMA